MVLNKILIESLLALNFLSQRTETRILPVDKNNIEFWLEILTFSKPQILREKRRNSILHLKKLGPPWWRIAISWRAWCLPTSWESFFFYYLFATFTIPYHTPLRSLIKQPEPRSSQGPILSAWKLKYDFLVKPITSFSR